MTDDIRVKTAHAEAFFQFRPKRDGDVGHDLVCYIDRERQTWVDRLVSRFIGQRCYVLWPFQIRSVPSTIHVAMPSHLWLFLDARSSARQKRIDVAGGRVIDSGYRGQLFSILRNFGFRPRLVLEGDRYAQAVFIGAVRPARRRVSVWDPGDMSARGEQGFGSTGR